jgi:hypothetical protein
MPLALKGVQLEIQRVGRLFSVIPEELQLHDQRRWAIPCQFIKQSIDCHSQLSGV